MARSDIELHEMLLHDLGEVGEVEHDPQAGVISLRGFPQQRSPVLRLHLTPDQLGQAIRDLAPDYAGAFPLLEPEDATLIVLWLDVLVAVERAGPRARDMTLWPPDAAEETAAARPVRRTAAPRRGRGWQPHRRQGRPFSR